MFPQGTDSSPTGKYSLDRIHYFCCKGKRGLVLTPIPRLAQNLSHPRAYRAQKHVHPKTLKVFVELVAILVTFLNQLYCITRAKFAGESFLYDYVDKGGMEAYRPELVHITVIDSLVRRPFCQWKVWFSR